MGPQDRIRSNGHKPLCLWFAGLSGFGKRTIAKQLTGMVTTLTVFWILGITNAVNLVDNMDGLSSSIAGIAAVSLAVMIQAELGMRGLNAIGMMVLVLGVPILDTTLVTVVRSLHNRPVSQGGRDHTSHRLVHAGLSEKQAVLLLYGLAAVFAVLAPVFYASDIRLRVSLTIFTFLGAVIFAVTLAVGATFVGLGLVHGFGSVSRGLIAIAWMAIVLGVIFSRFGFRGLRSWLTAASRSGSPVVVYGAGEEGASTLRVLRAEANSSLLRPVAVVDDTPGPRGRSLHGVPVIGGLEALPGLIRDAGVTELVLPTNHIGPEERDRIIRACRDAGLSCRTLSVDIRLAEQSNTSQELDD